MTQTVIYIYQVSYISLMVTTKEKKNLVQIRIKEKNQSIPLQKIMYS